MYSAQDTKEAIRPYRHETSEKGVGERWFLM
jgi:hypothetical protein